MTSKVNNKKTKRTKADIPPHRMNHFDKVAEAAGCTRSMVYLVLKDKRNVDTALGQRIVIADAVLTEEESKLLDEVKRIVKF